jgi:hypothetical protein
MSNNFKVEDISKEAFIKKNNIFHDSSIDEFKENFSVIKKFVKNSNKNMIMYFTKMELPVNDLRDNKRRNLTKGKAFGFIKDPNYNSNPIEMKRYMKRYGFDLDEILNHIAKEIQRDSDGAYTKEDITTYHPGYPYGVWSIRIHSFADETGPQNSPNPFVEAIILVLLSKTDLATKAPTILRPSHKDTRQIRRSITDASNPPPSLRAAAEASSANRRKISSKDISLKVEEDGDFSLITKIGDIKLLTSVAATVLRDLSNKIKEYDLVFTTPINLELQALRIEQLYTQITYILSEAGQSYIEEDFVKIKFAGDYNFVALYLADTGDDEEVSSTARLITSDASLRYFNDNTTNSIIFNLVQIYYKYGERIQQEGINYHAQNSVFFSEETIRFFLNKFIYPKTSIVLSPITKDIIEKFVIGDVRLLNEEVFKNYFMDPSQIPDGVRNNLQRQVSQQYEAIGDLMGDSWISGKFDRITDVDDLFEQLLNYVDIEDLISLSTNCLFKLIPIDELLDSVCEHVLKNFDKHQEGIIQGLDRMEDGISKDLSTELKEIYFNRVLGSQGILGRLEGGITTGIKNIPQKLQDASTLHSWENANDLQIYIDLTTKNHNLLKKSLTDDEYTIADALISNGQSGTGATDRDVDKTFIYSGLLQRQRRTQVRVDELLAELEKINTKLGIFNGINEPQNLVELKNYYSKTLAEQQQKLTTISAAVENGKLLNNLYETVDYIVPRLMILNPYLSLEDSRAITKDGTPYLTTVFSEIVPSPNVIADELNSLLIPEIQEDPIFTFGVGELQIEYPSKFDFNFQLTNGFKLIIDRIQQLQDVNYEESPFNVLAALENAGVQSLEDYLFNADTSAGKPMGLFADPTKRRYLCLAIIGGGFASIHSLIQLFKNLDDAKEFFKNEAIAIATSFKRKVQIFSRNDYPVWDILEEFVESLRQIGLNFTRDLMINGIMYVLNKIKKSCTDVDSELANAPFNPIGAIDLSDFMKSSKKAYNGQPDHDLKNTNTYVIIAYKDPSLTLEQFNKILAALSSSFTINQIARLLNGTAENSLYNEALSVLYTLIPEIIPENGFFYQYYVNEAGIREFFNILSEDIEPAKIARAIRAYNLHKERIIDLCLGNDDSVLKDLLGDIDEKQAKQFLADRYASKVKEIPSIVDVLDKLLGPNKIPEPCDVGLSTLTDSQKFTARQASDSIYGGIERDFEDSVNRVKTLLLDDKRKISAHMKLGEQANADIKTFSEFAKSKEEDIRNIGNSSELVAQKTLSSYTKFLEEENFFNLDTEDTGAALKTKIVFSYEPDNILKKINFEFDIDKSELQFQYLNLTTQEIDENANTIVGYNQSDYFQKIKLSDEEEIYLTPGQILFDMNNKGIIGQPEGYDLVKSELSKIIFNDGERYHLELLNSIFKDLSKYSLGTGLYKRENFIKFDLSKHIVSGEKKVNGNVLDKCFLGFANKKVLHRQTEYIADVLSCRNNSATKTPFNLAYIKVLFDCFIRSVVVQEMMSSFFVLGLFPQDLIFDDIEPDNYSIYENIINFNVVRSIEAFSPRNVFFTYDTFYNSVFKPFIVDMTKVITGVNDVTDKQAYDYVVNSQIQFVKNQFAQAYTNAFPADESIIGLTEYQLLPSEQQQEGTEANKSLLKLTDDFTYDERIRAIQNDGLAMWYESTSHQTIAKSPEEVDINTPLNTISNTKIFFGGDNIQAVNSTNSGEDEDELVLKPTNLEFNKRMPFFLREAVKETSYFELENFTQQKSSNVSILTADNIRGLILDRFIEIKSNESAFDDAQKQYIEVFLLSLGGVVYAEGGYKQYEPSLRTYRRNLRHFLYETRMFMLFPQGLDFIESLHPGNGENDKCLWVQYCKEMEAFDLFYWLFRYNYDVNFYADPEATSWHNKMIQNGLWSKLNLSLMGKIRLGDFYSLLSRFMYIPGGLDQDAYDINPTKPDDYISLEWIENEIGPAPNFANQDFGSRFIRYKQFFDHIEQPPWQYSDPNPLPNLQSFKSLNAIKVRESKSIFDNQPLFGWLYSKKINDLFRFNTTLRIDMKFLEKNFELTKKLSEWLFNPDDSVINIISQKSLLEEKIGPEGLNDPNSAVFSTPLFELKQKIPDNLTWSDFFINVDKYSYHADKDFYKLEDIDNKTVNEILFREEKNKNDIYSYFYRLKAFSSNSKNEKQTIETKQWISTYWWNIYGRPTPLEIFIKAIFLNQEGDWNPKPYIGPNGLQKQDALLGWEDIRNALTDESLASFSLTSEAIAASISNGNLIANEDQIGDKNSDRSRGLTLSTLDEMEKKNLIEKIISQIIDEPNVRSEVKDIWDEEKQDFKEGYLPFISIREKEPEENGNWVDHGFYDMDFVTFGQNTGNAQASENQYPGSEFESPFYYRTGEGQSPPLGPAPFWGAPLGQPIFPEFLQGTPLDEIYISGPYDERFIKDDLQVLKRSYYVKGGVASSTMELVLKPIGDTQANVYNLFSKMIKQDENSEKMFNDLLKTFFIKEQTTIIALIHRILLEKEYPAIAEMFKSLTNQCYQKLSAAVAAANGDYQHTSENLSVNYFAAAGEIGQQLLEGFIKACR